MSRHGYSTAAGSGCHRDSLQLRQRGVRLERIGYVPRATFAKIVAADTVEHNDVMSDD